jgi:GT2 family glycosyltransferase
MTRPKTVSVVVISRDEGTELRRTVENLEDTLPDNGEIVVVDDGSRDGSADHLSRRRGRVRLKRLGNAGVAKARNYGARQSRGDVVVFADAHIRLARLWWKPLLELLEDPKVGGASPAVKHLSPKIKATGYGLRFRDASLDVDWLAAPGKEPFAAPILPGCCMAMRRDVVEATGGWDEGMMVRGNVDNEGCVRFWLMGYDLMVVPEVAVRHKFRKASPYPIAWPEYLHNRLRLAFAHLNTARLGKAVGALRKHHGFGEALALVVGGNIAARRNELMASRVRSDDWYFERFGMKW